MQLAHWLIDIASDVHTILGHLHGDKKSQTGQDNEGEWISSPTLGTNELKSVRWYRASKGGAAIMRVVDLETNLPDNKLVIPDIKSQDDIDQLLGLGSQPFDEYAKMTAANYTELTHTWSPNPIFGLFMSKLSKLPTGLPSRAHASIPPVDIGQTLILQPRLYSTYNSANPFMKSGETPRASGATPVDVYVNAVIEHVAPIVEVGKEHGSIAARALVNRFNIV